MKKRLKRWSKADLDCLYGIKTFIEENLSQPLTLQQLTAEAAMNEKKLKEGFLFLHGTPLKQYILEKRMQAAHHLLCETDLPIKEIHSRCGYVNLSSFYRAFAGFYGYSPATLRRI
ncbi:MAG TPA: AraC family transcriptional regulator [Flavisolibacter sp.]|nr:AraC family transcriptional regulator [Flavisolibacter sp.]